MSIDFFTSILLLFILIYIPVNSENNIRNYVIHKSFLADIKTREFDVFDQTEKQLQYFIEARRNFGETIEIVASPSKQVIGKLKHVFSFNYKAKISILDSRYNRWINGTIKRNIRIFGSKYTIEWNGEHLSMKTKFGTQSAEFHDEKNKNRLAEFRKRFSSILLPNKYDFTVYSDKIPDAVYLLTIAVHDYQSSKKNTE
jgi:hypothetical protein